MYIPLILFVVVTHRINNIRIPIPTAKQGPNRLVIKLKCLKVRCNKLSYYTGCERVHNLVFLIFIIVFTIHLISLDKIWENRSFYSKISIKSHSEGKWNTNRLNALQKLQAITCVVTVVVALAWLFQTSTRRL